MPTKRSNPARTMWATLLLCLAGIALLIVDFSQRTQPAESIFIPEGPLGYVGTGLVALAVLSWLIVLLTCRCPSCGAWIHPWHYPRPGHHCPKCGDTQRR